MPITMQPVESSQLKEVGYEPETQTLAIRFNSKSGQGSLYHYANVPQEVYDDFMAAESAGSYFHRNIKPNAEKYPYQKIVEEPQ